MTLKEKFDSIILRHDLLRNEVDETLQQCEKIADDFAIGFGEYLDSYLQTTLKTKTIKELLEIYKKEKGL